MNAHPFGPSVGEQIAKVIRDDLVSRFKEGTRIGQLREADLLPTAELVRAYLKERVL